MAQCANMWQIIQSIRKHLFEYINSFISGILEFLLVIGPDALNKDLEETRLNFLEEAKSYGIAPALGEYIGGASSDDQSYYDQNEQDAQQPDGTYHLKNIQTS